MQPSEHSKEKYLPKILNDRQKRLIKSEANVKRKIRGPAGCGKTLVMTYRAVNAYLRTKQPVLTLTFNITLCNYIRDCISTILKDIPNKGKIMKNFFIIDHYHNFIKNYRNKNDQLDIKKMNPKTGKIVDTYILSDDADGIKYQTILVDETQDYEPEWINSIHKLLAPGGELVFFGDEEQNLYIRDLIEDDKIKNRIYTRIVGDWAALEKTYRLNGKIADLAHSFQLEFFSDFEDNVIEPNDQLSIDFGDDEIIEYYFTNSLDVDKIFDVFLNIKNKFKINDDGICILSPVIRAKKEQILLKLDKKFRDNSYSTMTTFEKLEDYEKVEKLYPIPKDADEKEIDKILEQREINLYGIQRAAKFSFQMESGLIKISTIHSYKGWGINNEILILTEAGLPNQKRPDETFLNDEMVYAAITRAKKRLVIVNIAHQKYDNFFSKHLTKTEI